MEKTYDWKDVANSQFDKAFTLALLVLLFGILVTPRVDLKKQAFSMQQMTAVELPPDERPEFEQPDVIVKPVIDIVISEELLGSESVDPNVIQMIQDRLKRDIFQTQTQGSNTSERPFEFVPYEDPPEPINPVPPVYPEFAKRTGLQGVVVLEVDVYRDGSLGKINVIRSLMKGPGGLDEAAIDAVKKWRFQPGKSGGRPVDTTVIIPIEFTITK
jgi:protein TonB